MAFVVWLIKKVFWLSVFSFLFLSFLIYAPFLVEFEPKSLKLSLPRAFVGPLEPNDLLSKSQHLFKGQLKGPESIAEYKGDLYTGTADGKILKVQKDKVSVFADVCVKTPENSWDRSKCGRPLGIRVDSKGVIYFIDAYHGLRRLDPVTKKTTTLLSTKTKVDSRASKFYDDLAMVEAAGTNGGHVFYITDVGGKWDIHFCLYAHVELEPTGRIIKYDENSKKATVVVSDLYFPNGVELTDGNTGLLINELSLRRILKYHITGPKTGKTETLVDNLPGEPDNIRRSANSKTESYWVALAMARNATSPNAFDVLADKPLLRKALFRFVNVLGLGMEYIGNMFNFVPLKEFGHEVKGGFFFLTFSGREYGMVMEVDATGKVLRSLHSPSGSTSVLSEVREVKEGNSQILYLGSYVNDYIGKLSLN